ncbi:NAD(P)-binding domain-containing protein [Arthrobacter sp. Br18]|uniref:NADPH-dependent F420 reductase n=1 Tax=Arthrobacter sp. Br18 TaxID=1312954 RepID=UPI00047E3CE4|nr:NAD(P)-binding domain-containing protein [Arthrobacter sp. Br18]
MTSLTIFGKGNMGSAIAGVITAGGASVEHIDNSSTGPALTGDVVVLAVPYPALKDITAQYGDQLAGKIVVDITNPLNFDTFDSLVVPADSCAATELAAALPNSTALKAFNTNFAATLASQSVGSNQTTVLIAGNDAAAKDTLAAAVKTGGADAVDAGSLDRARELEALGFLQLTLAASEKIQWTSRFALVR